MPVTHLYARGMEVVAGLMRRAGMIVTEPPQGPRERRSKSQLLSFDILLTAGMCVLLWGSITLVLYQQRAFALRGAAHDTSNISEAFDENTRRTVDAIDRTLLLLRMTYAAAPDHFDIIAWQRSAQVLDDLTFQLSIIDAAGILKANSLGPVLTSVDLSDRAHFRAQVTSQGDALFISKPLLGRESGKWSIQFTRKIVNADGAFEGVAVASLDPFSLARFYASVDLGHGSVLLVGLDGIVRGGAPISLGLLGRDISGSPLLTAARTATSGTLKTVQLGGAVEILSFRRLDRYGLVVAVGLDREEVLANYMRSRMEYLLGGAALTLLIVLAGGSVVRHRILLSRAQDTLARSQEMLTDTLEHMSQGIFMVDADRRIAVINTRATELLGVPAALGRVGMRFDDLIEWQVRYDGLDVTEPGVLLPSSGGAAAANTVVYERTRPNGVTMEVQTRRLSDQRAIRTFTDITDRKRAEAQIVYLAHHDGLTGLSNRAFFSERLSHAILLTRRTMSGFALLCLDLDRFKQVNDARGHDIGDRLLKMVADRLRANIRESDTVARFGGDEFAILQANIEQPSAAADLGQRLVSCLAEPYDIDGVLVSIGVSVGIAVYPKDGATAELLLKSSDIALYKAKEDGRGQACFFEPEMGRKLQERLALELDLREAIANEVLDVEFQPICDSNTGQLLAYEALARWTCPVQGSISPAIFVPLAEDTGLISALGRLILRRACREAVQWPAPIQLTVNLSPLQFLDPDLEEQIGSILSETGLQPQRLGLEVTERALIRNGEDTLVAMHGLRRRGIRIYLDDFGAGHAGLSYLIQFPFDYIKIDRSFVERLTTDRAAEAVIRATLLLGEFLRIGVVAEGVETEAQLQSLRGLGCHQVQGLLIDKPRPGRQLTEDRFWRGYGEGLQATLPASGS